MSLTKAPSISVIMATYGRGRLIEPSIRSVLSQDFDDWELLVVGDHCTDDTADCVAGFGDPRLRWINLPERWGSQSGPNNTGIASAYGQVIAYLGHDDIWEPFHLGSIAKTCAGRPEVDVVAAGCLLHLPAAYRAGHVTGLIAPDDPEAPFTHVLPPSALAHRRDLTERVGPWARPDTIAIEVDRDLQLRAARAGCQFVSTGCISVHKFTASDRYLAYLAPDCAEQVAMLADLAAPGHADRVAHTVDRVKRDNGYMTLKMVQGSTAAPGQVYHRARAKRGLVLPALIDLGGGIDLPQEAMDCGLDWQVQPQAGIRFTFMTERPRLALPVKANGQAMLTFPLIGTNPAALTALDLWCNGQPAKAALGPVAQRGSDWQADVTAVITLSADRVSLLEFRLSPDQAPQRDRPGIGVGTLRLVPRVGQSAT
jgi:hypothetical protein